CGSSGHRTCVLRTRAMSKTISARVTFLSPSQGGRSTPARSGIRPHVKLGDVFTTSIVRSRQGDEEFEFGRSYEVAVEIMFWDEYGHLFRPDAPLELFDGDRLIARGEFLAD